MDQHQHHEHMDVHIYIISKGTASHHHVQHTMGSNNTKNITPVGEGRVEI